MPNITTSTPTPAAPTNTTNITWPTVAHFMDADEIVADILTKLAPEDIDYVSKVIVPALDDNFEIDPIKMPDTNDRFSAAWSIMSFGRWIRNDYHLWHPQNPHTSIPHAANGPQLDANGADCSPYHADNYSGEVIKKMFKHLKENTPENKMINQLKQLGLADKK